MAESDSDVRGTAPSDTATPVLFSHDASLVDDIGCECIVPMIPVPTVAADFGEQRNGWGSALEDPIDLDTRVVVDDRRRD
ncbi:hypothetical protein LTR17_027904, partial [Elasticomyces elasticus]